MRHLIKRCSNIQLSIVNERNSIIDLKTELKSINTIDKVKAYGKGKIWRKSKNIEVKEYKILKKSDSKESNCVHVRIDRKSQNN